MIMVNGGGTDSTKIAFDDTSSVDAFGRLRVSNPQTLFDSKQIFDNAPLFWDDQEVSGSGTTSTYSQNKASTTLAVSASTAGRRIRQTFMRFNYQSGKSQLVMMTGTLGITGGGTGITRMMGQYDDNNGIFFKDNEGVVEAVIRSKTTGSVVDNNVIQSAWNLDKLDGTGASGITLDATKSQLAFFDYEWLSVGRVRMGFVFAGIPIYCHEFNHGNILEGAYMSTPNNPLRYEIENDGTGVASDLECICSTVISEGGQTMLGHTRHKSTAQTIIQANAITNIYMLLAIRLKEAANGATIEIERITAINGTGDDYEWYLILNPTIAGAALTWTGQTNSAIEFAIGNSANPSTSTVTNGTHLGGGFVKSGGSTGTIDTAINSALRLGETIAGVHDEIYLCVRPMTTNANVSGSISWREIN